MSEIFISHAGADQPLAKLLVDFLKEAIGVPATAIFCSSVKGHHIPFGEDFNAYIKKQIQGQKLVVLLMTPAYMESSFCLMELGAAWAQESTSLAVVVPPVDYNDVTKTLGLMQSWKITDKPGLIDLRELVKKRLSRLEERSEHTWEDKRANWNIALKKVLSELQGPTKVDAAKHQGALQELNEKNAEIEQLETSLGLAQEKYAALEKVKDKQELAALKKKEIGSAALQERFDKLIEAVGESKPHVANVVLKHIILDHYDLAGKIDWQNDKWEFEQAVKYGLISNDGLDLVRWDRNKLNPLKNALREVDEFLSSEDGAKLTGLQEPNVPMEPDDLEFWEHHLSI